MEREIMIQMVLENINELRWKHYLETQFRGWDSYYTLCVFSFVVGTIWYLLFFKKIKELQDTPVEEFRLKKKTDALLDEKSIPEKNKWIKSLSNGELEVFNWKISSVLFSKVIKSI